MLKFTVISTVLSFIQRHFLLEVMSPETAFSILLPLVGIY